MTCKNNIRSTKEKTTPLKNCPIYDLLISSINYSVICWHKIRVEAVSHHTISTLTITIAVHFDYIALFLVE